MRTCFPKFGLTKKKKSTNLENVRITNDAVEIRRWNISGSLVVIFSRCTLRRGLNGPLLYLGAPSGAVRAFPSVQSVGRFRCHTCYASRRLAIPTAQDLSGSGRVDMLTRLVTLARAAMLQREREDKLKTRICFRYVEVWELKLYFYPSAGGLKKKSNKKGARGVSCMHWVSIVDACFCGRARAIF